MSQKLQINSLEALERLIGGDTALEVEIRNNVANEFAKKHLKFQYDAALSAEARRLGTKLAESTSKEISDAVNLYFKESSYNGYSWDKVRIISDDCKAQVKAQVRDEIALIVKECVAERIDAVLREVKIRVDEVLRIEVAKQIADGVKQKLDELKRSI